MPEGQDVERKPYRFFSRKHLERWLAEHPTGKEILAGFVDAGQPRQDVILVLWSDGRRNWLQLRYNWKRVAVVILEPPIVCDETELLAEEWVRRKLPPRLRYFYDAYGPDDDEGWRQIERRMDNFTWIPMAAEQMLLAKSELEILKTLKEGEG